MVAFTASASLRPAAAGRATLAPRGGFAAGSPLRSRAMGVPPRQATRNNVVFASANDPVLRPICKAEIPAVIPRPHFVSEMYRWASLELQTYSDKDPELDSNHTLPIKVQPIAGDGTPNGFTIDVFNPSGDHYVAQLVAEMDDEPVTYYTKIERGNGEELVKKSDPKMATGKFFEIKKVGADYVDPAYSSDVKAVVEDVNAAIVKFYSFGSPFNDE